MNEIDDWMQDTGFIADCQRMGMLRSYITDDGEILYVLVNQPSGDEGYVYVLKAGPYYKIGKAKDADARITQLKIQLPFPVEVLYTIFSDNYHAAEAALHELFAGKRVNGEWFTLNIEDETSLCLHGIISWQSFRDVHKQDASKKAERAKAADGKIVFLPAVYDELMGF